MNDEFSVKTVNNPDQRRRRWLYASVAALAGLGGAGLAWWKFSPGEVTDEAVAALWQQTFDTPAGEALVMSRLKGRPLLINFWATWCPPCIEELPLLDSFFKENSVKGWQVVGLAVDQANAVRDFLARQPLSFPVGMAGSKGAVLSKTLGNLGGGLPFSLVLGSDGTIQARKIGKVSPQDLALWRELK